MGGFVWRRFASSFVEVQLMQWIFFGGQDEADAGNLLFACFAVADYEVLRSLGSKRVMYINYIVPESSRYGDFPTKSEYCINAELSR